MCQFRLRKLIFPEFIFPLSLTHGSLINFNTICVINMVERAHHDDLHILKSIEPNITWNKYTNIEWKGYFRAMEINETMNPTNLSIQVMMNYATGTLLMIPLTMKSRNEHNQKRMQRALSLHQYVTILAINLKFLSLGTLSLLTFSLFQQTCSFYTISLILPSIFKFLVIRALLLYKLNHYLYINNLTWNTILKR